MIKKLVIVLVAFFALQMNAQEGTASPYSFYGIGSLKFKGTVENRSMGGLSIYTDSIHVNLRNPAAYVGPNLKVLNYENRPVKFSIAASHNSINLKSDSGSEKTSATTIDYMALSIPLGNKLGFGLGILPYTSVGYKLEDQNNNNDVLNRYRGEGGLNKAFLGFGYRITDELSLGIDVHYNFGNIQNTAIEFLYDDEGNVIQYQSREQNRSDLSGLNINLGLTYKTMINEKLELQSGLTYSPQSNITSKNTRTFSTIVINQQNGQEFVVNTIDADLEALDLESTELKLPARLSFGGGIGAPRKWFLGAEYTFQNTSKFSNPIVAINNANFVNASNISIGGFFVPNPDSFSSYWKRATYRAGMHFENTGLEINNENINEFGISFGVGLPVGKWFSNANLGLEVGRRGTTNQNLIQENFVNFQFSMSLNDIWFEKRKYN
ncbi:outer membrane protein transport protein [Psychroserpens ponticola]|uniref:Outer membrane protein transport protein n=1 Tax=Psychroserpens ponticola TaxID=2932268 RepID=A0ABY7RWQ4_9FLAO|nr:outer membrane protein transport protein [Psychroserpens ponticola]WCO01187.1 outer membrane protein transport protein [Psychroserpens ponticola]